MDAEDMLLLFDELNPCWTADTLKVSKVDLRQAETCVEEGVLRKESGVYFLSSSGIVRFEQLAGQFGLPLKPGFAENIDRAREAKRSGLERLLDCRHAQRRGIKEFSRPFSFDVPCCGDEKTFAFDGEKLVWLYTEWPFYKNLMKYFPRAEGRRGERTAAGPDGIEQWLQRHMPEKRLVEADLLYKSHYDFTHYSGFPRIATDAYGFLNTDRFLFFLAPAPCPENLDCYWTILGDFHLFLTMLRHLYLPGYLDNDSLEQYSFTWLFFAYEREEDALRCQELLSPYRPFLSGEAPPFEIWTISLQALNEYEGMAELINDLLPCVAKPILRVRKGA